MVLLICSSINTRYKLTFQDPLCAWGDQVSSCSESWPQAPGPPTFTPSSTRLQAFAPCLTSWKVPVLPHFCSRTESGFLVAISCPVLIWAFITGSNLLSQWALQMFCVLYYWGHSPYLECLFLLSLWSPTHKNWLRYLPFLGHAVTPWWYDSMS